MSRALLLLLVILSLLACQPDESSFRARIEISEANSLSVHLDSSRPLGGAFSNRIELIGPDPVRITALRPVADEGLLVRYLGMCYPGCPGAVGVGAGRRTVRENLVATVPFELIPGEFTKLAFTLEPDGPAGLEKLRTSCLRFTELILTEEGGTSHQVRYCCGSFIDAIQPAGKGNHPACNPRSS